MADTRIEDRRRAFEKTAREQHPDMPSEWINARVNIQIAESISSPQTGSQVWMNHPAGLTVDEYLEFSTALSKIFTEEEKADMSVTVMISGSDGHPIFETNKEAYAKYMDFVAQWHKDHP